MAEILSYNHYKDMHNDVQFSAMFFGKNIQNIPIFNPIQTIEVKRLYYSLERFTFTGKERDSETGFSYFGARYYDSDILNGLDFNGFNSIDRANYRAKCERVNQAIQDAGQQSINK